MSMSGLREGITENEWLNLQTNCGVESTPQIIFKIHLRF
jgi:hypothetical protein